MSADCIRCRRRKLFDDKACPTHPETKTGTAERWGEVEEALDVLMLTAAIRTTAALKPELLEQTVDRMFAKYPESTVTKVVAQIEKMGPMTKQELGESIMMGMAGMVTKQEKKP